jgi:hypothetical protein
MFTESITRLRQSLSLFLFNLIYRLLFSRWVRDYSEHHDACEDAYSGQIGPFQLDVNECFVLDHRDASVGLCLPCPCRERAGGQLGRWRWGRLRLGYMVVLGEEQIRPPGWYGYLSRPLARVVYGRSENGSPEFPF